MKKLLPCLILLFGCSPASDHIKIKFDQEQWLQGDREVRGKMVDSIIKDSILSGKSKPEVLTLLGSPTASDTTTNFVYQVDIGEKTGPFGIGGIWLFFLTVEIDTVNNKVKNVRCHD